MSFTRIALVIVLGAVVAVNGAVLQDFQVAQPPPLPTSAKACTVDILHRIFGNSFGDPEIVQYTPPTDCGDVGTWAGVTLNLTATSNGTQFDRLSSITLQNVEIWRTSTPEPTRGDGIIWTFIKDVSRYVPLFSKPGTLIMDLDNLLETDPLLDGQYDVRLSATFLQSSASAPAVKKLDLIIPISTLSNNSANHFSVPPTFSLNVTFPRNAVAAYAEVYASGNGQEEFWYGNAANQFFNQLPSGATFPNGPFREVRLLVDGQLAGAVLPYPVYFTGANVPPAWRPITSYGALDLPTYFLDLTPFIPIFTDGNPHNISMDVVSAENIHTINQNWFISANIQVVQDSSDQPTTGKITRIDAPPFATTSTTGSVAENGDANITVSATHQITIEAEITSGSGKTSTVQWQQNLVFKNQQTYLKDGNEQIIVQTSSGTMLSKNNGQTAVQDKFSYPMTMFFEATNNGTTFNSSFDHSYDRVLQPSPLTVQSTIHNHQFANGTFTSGVRSGSGFNDNQFSYVDRAGNTYRRSVTAVNTTIVKDNISGSLARGSTPHFPSPPTVDQTTWTARFPGRRAAAQPGNGGF